MLAPAAVAWMSRVPESLTEEEAMEPDPDSDSVAPPTMVVVPV